MTGGETYVADCHEGAWLWCPNRAGVAWEAWDGAAVDGSLHGRARAVRGGFYITLVLLGRKAWIEIVRVLPDGQSSLSMITIMISMPTIMLQSSLGGIAELVG
jgi:hypothetical protein